MMSIQPNVPPNVSLEQTRDARRISQLGICPGRSLAQTARTGSSRLLGALNLLSCLHGDRNAGFGAERTRI
jgi:hypothetical protein